MALRWSEYAAVTYPHVTIAVSEALREDLISRHRDKSIIAIPNGVDPPAGAESAASVEQMGLTAGEYLLFIGRLVPEKGAHVLLDAVRLRPDTQVAIVGGSRYSDAYIERLKAMAGDNVRFLGFRYGSELAALYAHAQAVVVSSLQEGFSMVSIEAMSHGRPVIASDIPALRERLEERGYYFRPGDHESLVEAITSMQDDPPEASRRGALGKQIALRDYGWDRIAQLTLSALESIPGPKPDAGDSDGAPAHPEASR
jgi:glycosyltransferase involved in cell wall biosynthesis